MSWPPGSDGSVWRTDPCVFFLAEERRVVRDGSRPVILALADRTLRISSPALEKLYSTNDIDRLRISSEGNLISLQEEGSDVTRQFYLKDIKLLLSLLRQSDSRTGRRSQTPRDGNDTNDRERHRHRKRVRKQPREDGVGKSTLGSGQKASGGARDVSCSSGSAERHTATAATPRAADPRDALNARGRDPSRGRREQQRDGARDDARGGRREEGRGDKRDDGRRPSADNDARDGRDARNGRGRSRERGGDVGGNGPVARNKDGRDDRDLRDRRKAPTPQRGPLVSSSSSWSSSPRVSPRTSGIGTDVASPFFDAKDYITGENSNDVRQRGGRARRNSSSTRSPPRGIPKESQPPAPAPRESRKDRASNKNRSPTRRESRKDRSPSRRESRKDRSPSRRESRKDRSPSRRESQGERTPRQGTASPGGDRNDSRQGGKTRAGVVVYESSTNSSRERRRLREEDRRRHGGNPALRPSSEPEIPFFGGGQDAEPPTDNAWRVAQSDDSGTGGRHRRKRTGSDVGQSVVPFLEMDAIPETSPTDSIRRKSVSMLKRTNTDVDLHKKLIGGAAAEMPRAEPAPPPAARWYGHLQVSLIGYGPLELNGNTLMPFENENFKGEILVRVKNCVGAPQCAEYFQGKKRLFSVLVVGKFKNREYTADEVLYGAILERKVKMPYGAGIGLKFAKLIDPCIEYELYADQPWFLSPLIVSMNEARGPGLNEFNKEERRNFFKNPENRRNFRFLPNVEYQFEIFGDVMNWTNFKLSLGPLSLGANRYLQGCPVTFLAQTSKSSRTPDMIFWGLKFQYRDEIPPGEPR